MLGCVQITFIYSGAFPEGGTACSALRRGVGERNLQRIQVFLHVRSKRESLSLLMNFCWNSNGPSINVREQISLTIC